MITGEPEKTVVVSCISAEDALRRLNLLLRFHTRRAVADRLNEASTDHGVNLDQVNSWAGGRPIPQKYWGPIHQLFDEDCQVWEAEDFQYGGTYWRNGSFTTTEEDTARQALAQAFARNTLRVYAPNGGGINFDVQIRSVHLRPGVTAHTLVADAVDTGLYVVLVNDKLERKEQEIAAWDEYITHLAQVDRARSSETVTPQSSPAEMIRVIMTALNLSQQKLADEATRILSQGGTPQVVTRQQLAEWESGEQKPNGVKLEVLAQMFRQCRRFWPAQRFQHICTVAEEEYGAAGKDAYDYLAKLLGDGGD